jgi:hypothetical protein
MSKIEKLIKKIKTKSLDYGIDVFDEYQIEQIMQEYAEYYAKKCLEIAAENVELFQEGYYNRNDDLDYKWSVDRESITKIQLPEHE